MPIDLPAITNLVAWPIARSQVRLTWRLNQADWLALRIERDPGDGEFVEIGRMTGGEMFIDQAAPLGSQTRTIRYRITADGIEIPFGPVQLGVAYPDAYAVALNEDHEIFLRTVGFPTAYFAIKATPASCQCYDRFLKRSNNADCPYCGGKGTKAGYAQPVICYMIDTSPDPKNVQVTEIMEIQHNQNGFWCSGMGPNVKANDFFVTPTGDRFRVGNVSRPGIRGFAVIQRMDCTLIPPSEAEYDFEVPDALLSELRDPPNRLRVLG